jgi:hypothetical protein
MNEMFSNAIAGILAGFIAFFSNSVVQFLLNNSVNWIEAFLTAFLISIAFFLITFRYSKNSRF